MTEKHEKNPVVPNRYVDFHGDPIEGQPWSLKRVLSDIGIVATLALAGGMYVAGVDKLKIIGGGAGSLFSIPAFRLINRKVVDAALFPNSVIDTLPAPTQKTLPHDEMSMKRAQTINYIEYSVIGAGAMAFHPDKLFLGSIGSIAIGFKRMATARKVLKGDWVIVSRDEMKREAPAEEKKPEFAMGVQMQPIPVKPNLRVLTPFTLGRE